MVAKHPGQPHLGLCGWGEREKENYRTGRGESHRMLSWNQNAYFTGAAFGPRKGTGRTALVLYSLP